MHKRTLSAALIFLASTAATAEMKMTTATPSGVGLPSVITTRLGEFRLTDGMPDGPSIARAYDSLLMVRAVDAYLRTLRGGSLMEFRRGYRSVGTVNEKVAFFENRLDSKTLYMTGNTVVVYGNGWLDLSKGPIVIETPPNVLGGIDDAWSRYVGDFGTAGTDGGKGGKYIVLPPNFTGEIPQGYTPLRSKTLGNMWWVRALPAADGMKGSIERMKQQLQVYPWAQRAAPPKTEFVDMSGRYMNTVFQSDDRFFDAVNELVQEEPVDAIPDDVRAILATIGIEKGKLFQPTVEQRKTLKEAAMAASVMARSVTFASRDPSVFRYEKSSWFDLFSGVDYRFQRNGRPDYDAEIRFFYTGTGVTPAMSNPQVGVGSQYIWNALDQNGRYLDGNKTYRLTLPKDVPAKNFWEVALFDNQTRAFLQTDQRYPAINNIHNELAKNSDGSIDIIISSERPSDNSNWLQTIPGRGYWVGMRLYGPLQPWFDKSWRPGEITEELIK